MTRRRWHDLEDYLDTIGSQPFSMRDYAAYWEPEASSYDASLDIQCYLSAQRQPNSRTKYMLSRVPGTRTKGAQWVATNRRSKGKRRSKTLRNDVRKTVLDAYLPDMRRLESLDPRHASQIQEEIDELLSDCMGLIEEVMSTATA